MMFDSVFKDKKILVFGHTGFKGSWLTLWLNSLGAKVTGFSLGMVSEPSMFEVCKLENTVEHNLGDIRDAQSVNSVIQQTEPDFVFHLAAQPLVRHSYRFPAETIATNVLGTTHVLEALRNYNKPCTAIIVTSDKCYENVEWLWGYRENDRMGGIDPYSASKGAAEIVISSYCRSYFNKPESPVRCVSARAGNVIGGGDWAADRILPDTVKAWVRGESVTIRRPNSTRPWQHVLEPLSGYLCLAQQLIQNPALQGEAFNFGPAAVQDKTVHELLLVFADMWHESGFREKIIAEDDSGMHEAGLLKLCCDKALNNLGWLPTLEFDECMRFCADWYSTFYSSPDAIPDLSTKQIQEYMQFANRRERVWSICKD